MLKELIRKEILNNLLNLRFSLAYFLCTFLLIGSAVIMLSDFLTEKRNYDANTAFYGHQLDGITSASGYSYATKTALRPPFATKIFAMGGERDPDTRARIRFGNWASFEGDFKRNPLVNLFPAVDLLFVVGVILSLLIFVLTYDALSGEREEGTLKVLLSCPVPRDVVYFGKWVGGMVTPVIPLVTAWLAVMLILVVTPSAGAGAGEWGRMLAILGVAILYVATMFSLSLMVSVLAKKSSTSILVLLLLWSVGILVVPSVAAPIGYLLAKARTSSLVEASAVQAVYPRVKAQAGEMGDSASAYWQRISQSGGSFDQGEFDKVIGPAQRRFERMVTDEFIAVSKTKTRDDERADKLGRWISRVSPYGCLQNAAVALAGTGMRNEVDLRLSIEDFSRKTVAFTHQVQQEGSPFDIAQAPRFRYIRADLSMALSDCMIDIAALLLMGAVFFLAGYLRFLRMEAI